MESGDHSLEWVAQTAFEEIAQDQSLQGGLTARGYVPLLEWALDRALPAAACLEPDMDADKAAAMVAALLRRRHPSMSSWKEAIQSASLTSKRPSPLWEEHQRR